MGNSGCHYSLGLYIGETGWNSYLDNIRIARQEDSEECSQAMSKMDCINCDFTPMNEAQKGEAWEQVVRFGLENGIDIKKHPGIPEFLRFRPYLYPGIGLNGDDELYMTEALRAALFIARQIGSCMHPMDLGFTLEGLHVSEKAGQIVPFIIRKGRSYSIGETDLPGSTPVTNPKPVFSSPELALSIMQLKPGPDKECRQLMLPAPVMEKGSNPFFPVTVLLVDSSDGHVAMTQAKRYSAESVSETVVEIAMQFIGSGTCPRKIYVMDDITQDLLEDFCRKCGILLIRASRLKHLKEAWSSLNEMLRTR